MFVRPFHRMFYLDNMAIHFPFAKSERVSMRMSSLIFSSDVNQNQLMDTAWCIVYAAVFPALFLLLWAAIFRPSTHKNAVGRPRPDLIARCIPEAGTPEHKLVTFSVCTQTNEHILQEGWRSFPSGHSSFAFAGLGFLSLYVNQPHSQGVY